MSVPGHSHSALSLLFISVFCSKPPCAGSYRELPQVSVVEKVMQLFPSTENMMIVVLPLMFYKEKPAVRSTKLRRSSGHSHDSWRASNVLCHCRQMDRSMTYTYNPLQQSIQHTKTSFYLKGSMDAFPASHIHKYWGQGRLQPLAGFMSFRVCEKSRTAAPAGQANHTDDL